MINPNYTVDYFKPGDEVFYIPAHAINQYGAWLVNGCPDWWKHTQFEKGFVKSITDRFVFVNYFLNGKIQETAKATDPRDLVLWSRKNFK
jgi:hypothetical protein